MADELTPEIEQEEGQHTCRQGGRDGAEQAPIIGAFFIQEIEYGETGYEVRGVNQ